MLRSSFARTAIRRYATAPPPDLKPALGKPSSDAFLQNLLDKVKTIKDQPAGSTFVKKNSMDRGQSNNNNNNNRRNASDGNNYNNNRSSNRNNNLGSFNRSFDRNNNNNNRTGNRDNNNRRSNNNNSNKNSGSSINRAPPQQQFSKAEYAQQRRAKVEKKFGSSGQVDVFDSSSRNSRSGNNRARRPVSSIFAAKTGTRVSAVKRTRRNFNQVKDRQQTNNTKAAEEIYSPEVPRLPDLIKYSSNLAFSLESRMTRALFQVLQGHYRFPDLYSDKVDLLDHGHSVIPQQPLTAYPYYDKLPLSNSKLMGPTIINADFDFELLNKTIEKTVFGKFENLKIEVADDKLKLNAQVVQNSLNRNIFFNYSGRKERIYKSCTGLDSVQSLSE